MGPTDSPRTLALHCPGCGGPLAADHRACPRCGVTVATRRCGACFGLSLSDARNCRHCGSRLPEEDPGHRPDRLACCGCGAAMTPRRLEGTLFDECDHCGGLWLCPVTVHAVRSKAEARAMLRPFDLLPPGAGAEAAGARPAVTYRRCPVCARHMNRSNYARGSGVVIDLCRDHGSFFDRGELARIFRFIEEGGLEKAARRDGEDRRARLREARREAIRAGGNDLGAAGAFPAEPTGLDLIGWIAAFFAD